jgi:hypothetical protein
MGVLRRLVGVCIPLCCSNFSVANRLKMNLHVVAYPELSAADYEMIRLCRRDNNTLYRVIEPHFTLVFSITDMPVDEFVAEGKGKCRA